MDSGGRGGEGDDDGSVGGDEAMKVQCGREFYPFDGREVELWDTPKKKKGKGKREEGVIFSVGILVSVVVPMLFQCDALCPSWVCC